MHGELSASYAPMKPTSSVLSHEGELSGEEKKVIRHIGLVPNGMAHQANI